MLRIFCLLNANILCEIISVGTMVLQFVFVLLLFNFARTLPYAPDHELVENAHHTILKHNGMIHLIKRDGQSLVQNEGGPVDPGKPAAELSKPDAPTHEVIPLPDLQNKTFSEPVSPKGVNESVHKPLVTNNTESKHNATVATKEIPSQLDLKNPGVLKRGLIVFGSFGLMAAVYYIVFKRKSNKSDVNNTQNNNDSNQFRYGVLHSDDQRDNLELSRIPLTMDSEEDDDEDLEIFDLKQKKKSLSYVNLQPNEDDLDTISSSNFIEIRPGTDDDNLLLDIDTNEALINWSNQSDSHFNAK